MYHFVFCITFNILIVAACNMAYLQTILLCFLVLIKESQGLNEDAYMVLSTKIQGVSMEVNFLRNDLSSTKEKVAGIENRLEQGNSCVQNSKDCDETDKQGNSGTGSSNMNNKTEQYFNIMKKAWGSEKKRARDVENKIKQELIDTKRVVGEANDDMRLDIETVKVTMDETRAKLKGFSQRLDTVENIVGKLKTDQVELLAFLQADREKLERLETDFQSQKQSLVSLKEELATTKAELSSVKAVTNGQLDTLTTQLVGQEKCQSGNGVGVHTYPSRSFPYTVTVRFNPPFKRTPAFVYGTVLLDATDHTRYNAQLQKLTNEYFTISMSTWATYYLWGARISWMACPK